MGKCKKCGVEVPKEAMFCPNCGAGVSKEASVEKLSGGKGRRKKNIWTGTIKIIPDNSVESILHFL